MRVYYITGSLQEIRGIKVKDMYMASLAVISCHFYPFLIICDNQNFKTREGP